MHSQVAVLHGDGVDELRLVAGHVVGGHVAAVGLDRVDEGVADGSVVDEVACRLQAAVAIVGLHERVRDRLQRRREVLLHHGLPGPHGLPSRRVDTGRRRVEAGGADVAGQLGGEVGRGRETLGGQIDRRLQQAVQPEGALLREQHHVAVPRAGHQRLVEARRRRAARHVVAAVVLRSDRPDGVEAAHLLVLRVEPQRGRLGTDQVGVVRLDHAEHAGRGHRGIGGGPAVGQHVHRGLGGGRVDRDGGLDARFGWLGRSRGLGRGGARTHRLVLAPEHENTCRHGRRDTDGPCRNPPNLHETSTTRRSRSFRTAEVGPDGSNFRSGGQAQSGPRPAYRYESWLSGSWQRPSWRPS